MPGKEQSLILTVFKRVTNYLWTNPYKPTLVGEDYFGTKYYEELLRPRSKRMRAPRYFVPVDKENFEQEIPAEWEAWLRYRRPKPPTEEEVNNNYKLAMTRKENAAKLEAMYKSSKSNDETNLPAPNATPGGFPIYEEYKNYGRNYKPN